MAAKTPRGRKQKGKQFQNVIANDLRDVLCAHVPYITPEEIESTRMGQRGIDVRISARVRKLFPWAIECKNWDSVDFDLWWQQTVFNADKEGLRPLLIFKRPRSEPYVVIRWSDFLKLQNLILTLLGDRLNDK